MTASRDLEDRELVARARSGARDALEELVRGHRAWIYNIAVRMLYRPQDAEDAAQEILIKAVTGLASFEGWTPFRAAPPSQGHDDRKRGRSPFPVRTCRPPEMPNRPR